MIYSKPINIAVLDDEQDVHFIFKKKFRAPLKRGDIRLHSFINGEDFMKYLNKESEDIEILLVFSDINMPIMDGFSVLEVVKQSYPDIEIYMLSAYDSKEYINKAKQMGANDYFTKPVDFEEIKEKLSNKFQIKF